MNSTGFLIPKLDWQLTSSSCVYSMCPDVCVLQTRHWPSALFGSVPRWGVKVMYPEPLCIRARSHLCEVETSPPPEERCVVSASSPASRVSPPSPSSETPTSSVYSDVSSLLSHTPPPDYYTTHNTLKINFMKCEMIWVVIILAMYTLYWMMVCVCVCVTCWLSSGHWQTLQTADVWLHCSLWVFPAQRPAPAHETLTSSLWNTHTSSACVTLCCERMNVNVIDHLRRALVSSAARSPSLRVLTSHTLIAGESPESWTHTHTH